MHLAEVYALTCGLKIDKPYIKLQEIQIPSEPYITFHPHCEKGKSRIYKSWDLVIQGIKDLGYNIVQVGGLGGDTYDGVDSSYLGKTNSNELAFLIKNSSLHLGYDSFPVHVASTLGKKIVCLYSVYASHSRPYWSREEDVILLEPNWDDRKPSFSYSPPHEPLIDSIDYKEVIESVKELLP